MGQRLGIASALLLDEPVKGLDPEGVLWVHNLLRGLAAEGRTVLVSSHLMNEMAVTADQLVVIGKGRLIIATSMAELTRVAAGRCRVHLVRHGAGPVERRRPASGSGRCLAVAAAGAPGRPDGAAVLRRRRPTAVFFVIAAVAIAQWSLPGGWLQGDVALLIALYGVAAREPLFRLLPAAVAIGVVVVAIAVRWVPGDWAASIVLLTATACGAVAVGTAVRFRRDYLATLIDRAERLEIERDQRAQLAVAAERSRIAREMHDIVAHTNTLKHGGREAVARIRLRYRPDAVEVEIVDTGHLTGDHGPGRGDESRRWPNVRPCTAAPSRPDPVPRAGGASMPASESRPQSGMR